jgi:hypothetical protein
MNETNPYSAPIAPLVDFNSKRSKLPRYVLVALIIIQLIFTLRFVPWYFELFRAGAVRVVSFPLGILASLCLYTAAVSSFARPPGGKVLFLVAAIGLGLSAPLWHWPSVFSVVAVFGALLGLAGWWAVRKFTR